MEVIGNSIHNDGMPGIVPSGAPGADVGFAAEDIHEFPFSLVAELAAQDDGSHGC